MTQANIFFIIGVNGVGKSTLIPFLRSSLDGAKFVVHDFDERGVPNNADKNWRASETFHWMKTGKTNTGKGISTIICGFSKPQEIIDAAAKLDGEPKVCLLDANADVISQRILSRYITPESIAELYRTTGKAPKKFVMDNVYISSKFREESQKNLFHILDTSDLSPEQISAEIIKWVVS